MYIQDCLITWQPLHRFSCFLLHPLALLLNFQTVLISSPSDQNWWRKAKVYMRSHGVHAGVHPRLLNNSATTAPNSMRVPPLESYECVLSDRGKKCLTQIGSSLLPGPMGDWHIKYHEWKWRINGSSLVNCRNRSKAGGPYRLQRICRTWERGKSQILEAEPESLTMRIDIYLNVSKYSSRGCHITPENPSRLE